MSPLVYLMWKVEVEFKTCAAELPVRSEVDNQLYCEALNIALSKKVCLAFEQRRNKRADGSTINGYGFR